MKKLFSILFVCILCVSAVGCTMFQSCYVDQDKTPPKTEVGEVNIDRHDLELGNDVQERDYNNQAIKAFISKYNAAQTNPALRVNGDYKVSYNDFSKGYIISSDNVNLSVHLNDNGEVMFAGIAGDANLPVEQEIEVALAVFKLVSGGKHIPQEVLDYMNTVKSKAEELNLQATEAYQKIDQAIKSVNTEGFLEGLNTEVPEVDLSTGANPTLPPVEDIEDPENTEVNP